MNLQSNPNEQLKKDENDKNESGELGMHKKRIKDAVQDLFINHKDGKKNGYDLNIDHFSPNQQQMIRRREFEIFKLKNAPGRSDKITFEVFEHEVSIEGSALEKILKKDVN
jgi:hypothetical protein